MKKTLLFAALLFSTLAFSQTIITYPGNGKNKFGGAVGQGSLTVKETTDSVSFSLTRGPGLFDSIIVFYIDLLAGGISSTAGLTGSSSDAYLAAVAGHNPSKGRAVLNFPGDFQPDGAIAFDKNGGKIYYFITLPFFGTLIQEGTSFSVDPAGTNSAATYTQSSSKADLGLSGSLNFKFVGSYISNSASRSDEAFGDAFNNYGKNNSTSSYDPYTITNYFTFVSGPLPVSLTDFKAAKENSVVNIYWSVADETNIDNYEVQRSGDGISFFTIASVRARNSAISSSYNIKDASAQNGDNYYRLIITEKGKSELSKVVYLKMKGNNNTFIASCTSSKTLNVTLNGVSAGAYKLCVINSNGQLVQAQNLKVDANWQNMQIQLKQNLKGIYTVALQSAKTKYTANIFVQ